MYEAKLSFYQSKSEKKGKNIGITDYIEFIRNGANQDDVIKGRLLKQQGDLDGYKAIKNKTLCVTGSCTIQLGKSKESANIDLLNGLIVMDFDEDQVDQGKYNALKNDKHTYIIHESFGGGQNYCVFVKIDPNKFEESFLGLAEYYSNTYSLSVDISCKNKNRLRFLSYDRYIHVNDKSVKFIAKDVKRMKPIPKDKSTFVFLDSDFDSILEQIDERAVDLCREDYFRYLNIGLAIANHFGEAGRSYFHRICQYGGKYNDKKSDKDYSTYIRQNNGGRTISTVYYYAKEEGLDVYSDRTKDIINRVKSAKTFGVPTVDNISKTLESLSGSETTEKERIFIDTLIKDKNDYSQLANEGVTEIEQLEKFVVDNYSPEEDELTGYLFVRNTKLTKNLLNDICISAKKTFDFKVMKSDVQMVLNSSATRKKNVLAKFLKENEGITPEGYIDRYIEAVKPVTDYKKWAFKKWLVGCIHNWTSTFYEEEVSPLTLVLTGQDHGSGKTSFFRNSLPKILRPYFKEGKVTKDKDSEYLLATCLLLLDDEFGGEAFKDDKQFKTISDKNIITQRRPYSEVIEDFKRRASLCGTSNEMDILKDVTGNRRILPIQVDTIDYETIRNFDSEMMIIEAYNLLKSGFEWRIYSSEDKKYIKENCSENEAILPVEERFFRYFRLEPDANYNVKLILNMAEFMESMCTPNYKPSKADIKQVMVKNKLVYKLHRLNNEDYKKGIQVYMKAFEIGELGLGYVATNFTEDPKF